MSFLGQILDIDLNEQTFKFSPFAGECAQECLGGRGINALSPQTGLLGSSNVGGGFGPQLRACGIQQLIIRGKAPNPVYLWIDGDSIEIRNAKLIWGLETWATQEQLKNKFGS